LAPWIYKTREAIIRTVRQLSGNSSVLHLPFVWYGQVFLRVTQAISRRQEFAADALAARTVGARPLGSGLRTIFGAALANHRWPTPSVAPRRKR
jgi:Zn-dependent protease with chaperone function